MAHRLTKEERIKAIQRYYETRNATQTARLIANEFSRPEPRRQLVLFGIFGYMIRGYLGI